MTPVANRYPLIRQLGVLLRISGAAPRRWVITTVAASVALAALDMAGVAAMIPLMQLITTGAADGAVLSWTAGVLGTDSLSVMIPVISGFVVLAFLVKTAGSLVFRWWLLGRTNRVTALAAAELMNRYVLAPYAAHRTRSLSVLYRNVNDATNQAASVLLALVTLCSDVLVLVAIMLVLALASPLVTLFAATLFGALVFGVQRMLRKRQLRLGEEAAEAGLEAWQALLPGLEGFRETRLTSSASTLSAGSAAPECAERTSGARSVSSATCRDIFLRSSSSLLWPASRACCSCSARATRSSQCSDCSRRHP